ncbi:leucine-rich repeat domain-containing protein [Rhodopirellula sallentina]|uniref:Adenylate cyclase regulatory protein n=1 Tax=Rhodopirellula sallentina SM41 TaxID=1263870 RepID=M5TY13_9BACT|nr:adenylate cyclase regulatory protein [Rhodopirellula sallentina]EMI53914.1 adenylate cyclase regulatory protein [Rhodopirellula sallentina SM41]
MNAPPDDAKENPAATAGDTDTTGDVAEEVDGDSAAEQSPGGRLAVLRRMKKPLIGMAGFLLVVVLAVLVWKGLQDEEPVAEQTTPTVETSSREQFAEQVESILKGESNRLYFFDLEINDELLDELPLDTLIQESIDAAEQQRILAEESAQVAGSSAEDEDARESAAQRAAAEHSKDDEFDRHTAGSRDTAQPAKTFARLNTVLIDQGVVTDKGLDIIAQLPDLEHLRLRLSPVTDEGIVSLTGSKKLWLLNLPHSRITTEGVRKLQKLPKLKQLRLGSPRLSNECCRAIAELKTLRGLHLIGVPVTDDGLKTLTTLPRLESLYLDDPAVTETGWSWLFRNHPQLHVHVNQEHHDRDPHAHVH